MAHEGGHSMHSWYSVRNNPFMSYEYTIFEAEVASTFNEELVFKYLIKNAKDRDMRLYLMATHANDILATLYRQTMFAEFELRAHETVENGQPLSTEVLRSIYRNLLEQYFGSEMHFENPVTLKDSEFLTSITHSMCTNMQQEFLHPLHLQNASLKAGLRKGTTTLGSLSLAVQDTRLKA